MSDNNKLFLHAFVLIKTIHFFSRVTAGLKKNIQSCFIIWRDFIPALNSRHINRIHKRLRYKQRKGNLYPDSGLIVTSKQRQKPTE